MYIIGFKLHAASARPIRIAPPSSRRRPPKAESRMYRKTFFLEKNNDVSKAATPTATVLRKNVEGPPGIPILSWTGAGEVRGRGARLKPPAQRAALFKAHGAGGGCAGSWGNGFRRAQPPPARCKIFGGAEPSEPTLEAQPGSGGSPGRAAVRSFVSNLPPGSLVSKRRVPYPARCKIFGGAEPGEPTLVA